MLSHTAKSIRDLRKSLDLTQAALGEVLGCSSRHISGLENGKVVISPLLDLALDAVFLSVKIPRPRLTGEQWRFKRTTLDLTCTELAKRLDISESMVYKIETGRSKAGRNLDARMRAIKGDK